MIDDKFGFNQLTKSQNTLDTSLHGGGGAVSCIQVILKDVRSEFNFCQSLLSVNSMIIRTNNDQT